MKKLSTLLLSGSFILALSSFASRFLGVYRDHLFAKYFGVSAALDAYYAAFAVPDLLYAVLILSSISAIFLPMFQRYKVKQNWNEAWKFTSEMLNSLFLVFAGIALLFIFFTDVFVSLYVPKFSQEQHELTVNMIRIMMLSPLFFLLSSVMISVENAFHSFFAQALSPILYNVGIIAGIIFLSPLLGVEGVAYGVVVGAFLQMLIQVPFFIKTGFRWSFGFLKGNELKETLIHFWPRVLSTSITHVSLTANVVIAATISTGAVTLYSLAFNIQSFTYGMIAVSFSIPAFAMLTQKVAENDMQGFVHTLQRNFEKTLFWIIPANVGLFLCAKPIVQLLLHYGKFTEANVNELVHLIQIYALGLVVTGVIILIIKAYLALQKSWFITIIGALLLAVDIGSSVIFSHFFGVSGLIWGTVLALNFKTIVLILSARKHFGFSFSFLNVGKIVLLAGIMFSVIDFGVAPQIENTPAIIQLIVFSSVGAFVYLGGSFILKVKNRF